jgi:hypothetical protein
MRKIVLAFTAIVLGSMFLGAPAPFTMRVVDADTGVRVAGLRVTTDNGLICYTLNNGAASWPEWSLMGRHVRFALHDSANRYADATIAVGVSFGGRSELKVHRQ